MKFLRWWQAHFLYLEFAASISLTTIFFIWVRYLGGEGIVNRILQDNRSELYNALSAVFGSLLGFIIAAVAIVLGYSNDVRLAILQKSKHYPLLWEVLKSTIRALGFATIASLLGLILDRDDNPILGLLLVNIFSAILASLRLARSVWVLENVIAIATRSNRPN